MRASPTRAVIEPLLVALYAFPTNEVRGAVRADEFDHVIGDSITALAAFDCFVFRHLVSSELSAFAHYQASLRRFQNAAI
jgi:hypothetical protein